MLAGIGWEPGIFLRRDVGDIQSHKTMIPVSIKSTAYLLLTQCRLLRECPAYTLLYQFSPKDTGQSKVK